MGLTIDTSESSHEIGLAVSVDHWKLCPSRTQVRRVLQRALHRNSFRYKGLLEMNGARTVHGRSAGQIRIQLL